MKVPCAVLELSVAHRQTDMVSNRILQYSASKAPSLADGPKHTTGIIQTARASPLTGWRRTGDAGSLKCVKCVHVVTAASEGLHKLQKALVETDCW